MHLVLIYSIMSVCPLLKTALNNLFESLLIQFKPGTSLIGCRNQPATIALCFFLSQARNYRVIFLHNNNNPPPSPNTQLSSLFISNSGLHFTVFVSMKHFGFLSLHIDQFPYSSPSFSFMPPNQITR